MIFFLTIVKLTVFTRLIEFVTDHEKMIQINRSLSPLPHSPPELRSLLPLKKASKLCQLRRTSSQQQQQQSEINVCEINCEK